MCIDYEKCYKVVLALNDFFINKNDVASIEYPSSIICCSDEYFLYMFYSCLLDYGMRSKIYHMNLTNAYNNCSDLFNPKCVLKMSEEDLKNTIVSYIHPRYPNVAVKKWINLSSELIKYDSIVEYLKMINSFNELCDFIKNIKGFGQKTGGLLIRIISDSNICNFNEEIVDIPIDRHDIEISYLTGIISTLKLNEKDIKSLSDAYVDSSRKLNINPSDADKYLWEIGSSFCNYNRCVECPLCTLCSKSKL